jgi:hypothetical protein
MAVVDTTQMRQDFFDVLREFRDNKERTRQLNERNREMMKYLDETYGLEKGAAKAYIQKKLAEENGKDRSEDVAEIETLLND